MKEPGYVYILTNPSFKEDWVKIGKSSRPVDIRSKELDNTAVPLPFEIYATLKTAKYSEVELQLHKMIDSLTDIRIRPNREFFNIAPNKAFELLKIISQTLDDAEIIRYNNNLTTNSTLIDSKISKDIKIVRPSNSQEYLLKFWTKFNINAEKNQNFINTFKLRKPHEKYWYDLSIGHSKYRICLTASIKNRELTAGLYFSNCKNVYEKFAKREEEIKEIIGGEIEWIDKPDNKDARLLIRQIFNIENTEDWDNGISWLHEKSIQLYSASKLNIK